VTGPDGRDRLLRGEGRFTADLDTRDALHAAFVRSDRAHARIISVDLSAARVSPGVVAAFAAGDLGEFGRFPAFLRYSGRDDAPLRSPGRPPLASDMVRHVGEIVAVVVADSEIAAIDGAEAVAVDYEDREPLIGLDAALAGEAIHAVAPGNVAVEVEAGDPQDVSALLAASADVVDLTVDLPRLAPAPMEPRAALARYDREAGRFILRAPHQGAPEPRRDLAAVLQTSEDRIDVLADDVGGAFGARGPAYPEHAVLLRLAERLDRPVVWRGTRLEAFTTDHPGRGTRLTGRLGLDDKGRFTALDVLYEADLGAYVTPVGAHINVHNPLQTLTGAYRIPKASALFRLVYSNATPIGPYRGAGRPDMAFLVERLVDEAARRTGIDRVALRRRNLVPRMAFPYVTATGSRYDSGDYRALLDRAAEGIDWARRRRRASALRRLGLLHGVGLSLFVEVAGGGPVTHDEVRLRVEQSADGARVVVETLAQSTGQSHGQTFRDLAARELGLDANRIDVRSVAQGLAGAGAFASRATSAVGVAVAEACRLLRAAAGGDVAAALADPAFHAALEPVTASAPNSLTFPSGCHAAEVSVDPETGLVTLLRYVAIDDAGRVLSAPVVHGQIRGGVAQGFGGAVLERMVLDPAGQVLTSSFMDYALPRAADLVAVEADVIEVPSPNNPLGVKGVGEAGTTGALGALANAVADALASVGRGPLDIPLTPARVWRALKASGR
jgi:carbon-monoxide dehydrogenase large subunit